MPHTIHWSATVVTAAAVELALMLAQTDSLSQTGDPEAFRVSSVYRSSYDCMSRHTAENK